MLNSYKFRSISGFHSRGTRSDDGVALLMTLLALSVMMLLGLGLTMSGMIAVTTTANDREATEVLYIAESGSWHARALVAALQAEDYSSILTAGDGTACNGDELSTQPANPITSVADGGHAFGSNGRYEVSVCNDSLDPIPTIDTNRRIVVRSTGFGRNDSTATVETILMALELPALLVDGRLRINGNPSVIGAAGIVHSNGTLDFDGTPCASLYYSSASSITDPTAGKTGVCPGTYDPANVRASQDRIVVPDIDPASFQPDATHILGVDGTIRDQAGNDITSTTVGWSFSSGRWEVSGSSMSSGTYYATANIKISGSPNALGVTLITTGYIDISGNPVFTPNLMKNGVTYSMIAGTDLKIGGNSTSAPSSQGLHYARHQINFSGNPVINGQVIASDLGDITSGPDALVDRAVDGFMSVSGNPTISFNGGGGLVVVSINGWREAR